MEIKDLKALVKIVTDTDITEFEFRNEDEEIVIRRGSNQEMVQVAPAYPQMMPAMAPAAPVAAPQATQAAPAPVEDDKYEAIPSPLVGTFYQAPSPESPSYVEVGQVVDKGQILCIVEAMKIMNEIEADFKCKIVEIVPENAEPVEFGAPLFKVERV